MDKIIEANGGNYKSLKFKIHLEVVIPYMKKEFEIPDSLVAEMAKYSDVDWNSMIVKSIEGMLYDFSIIEKLKEFWGTARK